MDLFTADSLLFAPAATKRHETEKQARLFSGNVVTLRPRPKKTRVVDVEKLALEDTDTSIDMDLLFKKVEQAKSTKASRDKIRAVAKKTTTSQIWTEKYKPQRFLQLCSAGNEKQYRAIMHWIKKWAPVVFGEESSYKEVDPLGRPWKKILLVHGPLGIGKSAAVHLLAKQMGYAVQELNAANSMDALPQGGSGNAFQNANKALRLKITNALTSNAITAGGAPSCLVIDEIDTAVNCGDIVKVLSELVGADNRTHRKDQRKRRDFVLNRPIICIANDIYTNRQGAMERLRPMCEVVAFKKAEAKSNAIQTIKEHLMAVCQREKLALDYQVIGDVVDMCEGDIRACLNHLQFSGRPLDADLAPTMLRTNKDTQLLWFAMVDLLFKRNAHLSKDEDFLQLLDVVTNGGGKSACSSLGSLDKVVRGCFNRYLDAIHMQDDSLVKPGVVSDWLAYHELMRDDAYLNLVTLKMWTMFSEINPRHKPLVADMRLLEFDAVQAAKENSAAARRLVDRLPLSMRQRPDAFVCHTAPYLDHIMAPPRHDDADIAKVTDLVGRLNLKLESHRDLDTNTVSLHFQPSWDSLVNYNTAVNGVPPAAKAKQTQLRRHKLFPLILAEQVRRVAKPVVKRQLADLSNKPDKKKKPNGHFFKGRYDDLAVPAARDDAQRIWVKYHEGFSNAVRKNIGWHDLWV